ncbi:MAG: hypothetical protein JSS20_04780 [Proteobacteria bacterium]|nr:hypothetical protein [Pseudomonadota bacterium]
MGEVSVWLLMTISFDRCSSARSSRAAKLHPDNHRFLGLEELTQFLYLSYDIRMDAPRRAPQ